MRKGRLKHQLHGAIGAACVSVSLVAIAGCSSTLDEYRCTSNAECGSDDEGLCHPSGYCAFLDVEGCDGYRFGKLSGERSEQCVSAEETAVDAGQLDAPTVAADADPSIEKPIAIIADISPGCNITAVDADGSASQSFRDTTLTNFKWTLRNPEGEVIRELNGGPADGFKPGRAFIKGTIEKPTVNLTPYMDKRAIYVDSEGAHIEVEHPGIVLSAGAQTLSFAIATVDAVNVGDTVNVVLVDGLEVITYAMKSITLTSAMTYYSTNFNLPINLGNAKVRIISELGAYYLDAIRVHKNSDAGSGPVEAVTNGSLEEGYAPWFIDVKAETTAHSSNDILPASLRQYGQYTLQLQVTDSNGGVSAVASEVVNHVGCN